MLKNLRWFICVLHTTTELPVSVMILLTSTFSGGSVKTLHNNMNITYIIRILRTLFCFRCFLSKDSSGSQSSGPSRLIGGDRPDSRDTSHSEYQETRSETLTHSDTSGGGLSLIFIMAGMGLMPAAEEAVPHITCLVLPFLVFCFTEQGTVLKCGVLIPRI